MTRNTPTSAMPITVAVDAMGGDHGPSVTLPAALAFLEATPDARVIAVGLEAPLRAVAREAPLAARRRRLVIHAASEVVEMHEPPADALRHKKDSSMRVAINLVKDGTAQACVSAGNTGALMAIARFVLKTLPGIDRPAIASQLPTRKGVTTVLDLGANVNCTPEQLVQFAVMGTALVTAVDADRAAHASASSTSARRTSRATTSSKAPAELLKVSGLNFVGNVEGNDIYKGTTDVVVCDGFVGNVMLKDVRGPRDDALRVPEGRIHPQPADQGAALIAYPVLMGFKRRIDPRRLQRRDADRPEGRRREEPRRRRYARVPARAGEGPRRSDAWRAGEDRAADGGDARRSRSPRSDGERAAGRRCIAASSAPAATCRRRS